MPLTSVPHADSPLVAESADSHPPRPGFPHDSGAPFGRGAGYLLGRKPAAITLGEIVRVLDGPLAAVPCVSQTAYTPCEECGDEDTCAVRLAMKEVRDATARILDGTTLAAANARAGRAARAMSIRRAKRRSDSPATRDGRLGAAE